MFDHREKKKEFTQSLNGCLGHDEARLGEMKKREERGGGREERGGGGVKLPSIVSGMHRPRCPACFVAVLCCGPGAEGLGAR